MEGTGFYEICSVLAMIGSAITTIILIYNLLKKPAEKLKEKQDAETKNLIKETINEAMPALFLNHDLETREKYLSDREKYLEDISNEVLEKTMNIFADKFKNLDNIPKLIETLDKVVTTEKDVLRDKIIKIYTDNKSKKTLTTLERERLTQFYIDYKSLKGNSYIDKYYKRMEKWKTIEDLDDDNDII